MAHPFELFALIMGQSHPDRLRILVNVIINLDALLTVVLRNKVRDSNLCRTVASSRYQ